MLNECLSLFGLSLEKLMLTLLPIYEIFAGFSGLILCFMRKNWNDWEKWKKDKSDWFYWSILLWVVWITLSLRLFFSGWLLRKAAKSKKIVLFNLWIFINICCAIISTSIASISFFMFPAYVSQSSAIIAVAYDLMKVYICLVVRYYCKLLKHEEEMKSAFRRLTVAEISEFTNGLQPSNVTENSDIRELARNRGYQNHFEINFERLSIGWNYPLGKGEYGSVYKGYLDESNYSTEVAVKVIDPEATDASCFKLVLSELKVMTYVGEHPNIVRLIGANTSEIENRKLFIVLEFCVLGNLLDKLRTSKGIFINHVQDGLLQVESDQSGGFKNEICYDQDDSICTLDLIRWSHEISAGMEFLESKRLVHGDLAARNILLTDQKVAKISDFGLSRQLYHYSVYVKKSDQPVPWMNLAIESILDHQFSSKSDVWSYGIILFEMFSLGEVPYPQHSFDNQFIREIKNGLRPSCPPNTPSFMYQLMQRCWSSDMKQRPSFAEIVKHLDSQSKRDGRNPQSN